MAPNESLPIDVIQSVESLWGTPLQPAGCPACKKAFLIEAARIGNLCPNCAAGNLKLQPALLRREAPELLVPFRKGRAEIQPILASFVKGIWLKPKDFNIQNLLNRVVPVFWPMWLVDCALKGEWQAEAGFDYQVKSSQEFFRDNAWRSRDVVETRVRWEPRLGQINREYENIAVPAPDDYQALIRATGEYDRSQAAPYQANRLGHAVLLVPDLQPENVWPTAQSNLNKAAAQECQRAASAQHLRNFSISANYRNLNWTQILLPMYMTYYKDDEGHPQIVRLNGLTGSIAGPRLASQRKGWIWAGISLGAGLALFLLGLLGFALSPLFPPASILAVVLITLAFIASIFAILPVVWPWQWNRNQKNQNSK
jgi:hypothetical protein